MAIDAITAGNANLVSISAATAVFALMLYDAILLWWPRKTSPIQILNVLQVLVEFYSYFLAVTFRFAIFSNFSGCVAYRLFINLSFNYVFVLGLEAILILKARAAYVTERMRLIMTIVSVVLVIPRLILAALNLANGPATFVTVTGTCFTAYDPTWNTWHSFYRVFLDLLLAIMFLIPVAYHMKSMNISAVPTTTSKNTGNTHSPAAQLYIKLWSDGILFPTISFAINFILQFIISYVPEVGPITQSLFVINNIAAAAGVHFMVRGVQEAVRKTSSHVGGARSSALGATSSVLGSKNSGPGENMA